MRRFTVIISGASGSAYGMRLIEQLLHAGEVTVLLTRTALERLAASSALSCLRPVPARPCWASWSPRLGCSARPGGAQRPRPGSVGHAQRVDAVIAAPRETPLSLIHLRNLMALPEAGAIIVPPMPPFYERPESVDDLVSFVVGKVLDVIGVEHALFGHTG